MTTEFVLLMTFFALILFSVLFGENGPSATFADSSPRLAARLEKNIATGTQWTFKDNNRGAEWQRPSGPPPQNR